jgi:hypothetical protein
MLSCALTAEFSRAAFETKMDAPLACKDQAAMERDRAQCTLQQLRNKACNTKNEQIHWQNADCILHFCIEYAKFKYEFFLFE